MEGVETLDDCCHLEKNLFVLYNKDYFLNKLYIKLK